MRMSVSRRSNRPLLATEQVERRTAVAHGLDLVTVGRERACGQRT